MQRNSQRVLKLVLAAACLALGYLLPFLTAGNYLLGQMFSPMHIPALLCGFLCGWPYGLTVGFILPLTRSFLFGAPPIHTAIIMAAELATYGAVAGLLYQRLSGRRWGVILALILSMLAGRVIGGLVSIPVLSLFAKNPLSFTIYLTNYFVTPWPAILIQLLIVPSLVNILESAKLLPIGGAKSGKTLSKETIAE